METIHDLLLKVYGEDAGPAAFQKTTQLLKKYKKTRGTPGKRGLDQRDVILITYADQVRYPEQHPLAGLAEFCRLYLTDKVTGVHILPFYPWTSDDGFAVIDYRAVDARYGTWDDLDALGRRFRLMFDAVINHVSAQNGWFRSVLQGDPHFKEYFITPGENDDLSRVVRPRALPLLTVFQTAAGEKKIWTTFSADQVDLNFANPDVLLEILDVLLFYVSHGAEFIRLDAIAYLWKEPGTSCINLPQTHWIVQLFRAVLDEVAPSVMLITETNVPHRENISYFGDGTNEAQLVYNFSLPPLVLHAFQTGSAAILSRWAQSLHLPSDRVTFFNFLASHDGIGLNPLRGIISEPEIEAVIRRSQSHGGLVSYKSDVDGSRRAYELNINYFDALNDPNASESVDVQIDRFVTAHAILLALKGLPGLYFHSLVGSQNWLEGVQQTGHNRTINRRKFQRDELLPMLSDPRTRQARVFFRLSHLLKIRRRHAAFHPHGFQQVIDVASELFAVLRISPDGQDKIMCLQNVSGRTVTVDLHTINPSIFSAKKNLITGASLEDTTEIIVLPYRTVWLA